VLLVHGLEIEESEATEQAEFLEQQGTNEVTPCLAASPSILTETGIVQ
jgi:hypothetical protein